MEESIDGCQYSALSRAASLTYRGEYMFMVAEISEEYGIASKD